MADRMLMDILHEAGGADVRMIDRLLPAEDGTGRNDRLAQRVDCFVRRARGTARSPRADDGAVLAALEVVGKARDKSN